MVYTPWPVFPLCNVIQASDEPGGPVHMFYEFYLLAQSSRVIVQNGPELISPEVVV